MQLTACLLLFIITTDQTLASLHYQCHGLVDVAREPSGHIGLSSVGVTVRPSELQTQQNLIICTRTLQIPAGHVVHLKLVWLERGSNMWLRCVLDETERGLEIGDTALLAACDQNKATLTWTGAGHSSNAFQLFYFAEADVRSSTEASSSPRPDPTVRSLSTGSSFTRRTGATEEVTAHRPQSVQRASSGPDPGPKLGLAVGEAAPFPEEERDNGADVSERTDNPHLYVNTQHSIRTDSVFQTEVNTGETDTDSLTDSSTSELRAKQESSSSINPFTDYTPTSAAIYKKSEASTRSEQTSTQTSAQTAAVTSESLNSSSDLPLVNLNTANTDKLLSSSTSNASDSDSSSVRPQSASATLHTSIPTLASQTQTPRSSERFTQASPSFSTFGESRKDETQTNGDEVFSTVSYVEERTKDNEQTSFTTMSTNTETYTVHSTDKPTDSPSFTSVQQSVNTSSEGTAVGTQTDSYELTSAATPKATSTIPYRVRLSPSPGVLTTLGRFHESRTTPTTTTTGTRSNEEAEERSSTVKGSHPTPPRTVPDVNTVTKPYSTSAQVWSSTVRHKPRFYVVPDEPAAIRVEVIELLLQIIVEEVTVTGSLEEDTAHWLEPFLQRAPGFRGLLGVWSSGLAVQCLLEFDTEGALTWLDDTAAPSLLELTGLARAVPEGRSFRSSRIRNITLGGLQGDVCGWLLQCPSGFTCVFHPENSNYSCTSVCRSDYCHHHGLCTHHPGQLPVCWCLVGEDFWFMGQRCDVRMTRARLVASCLAVLLVALAVTGVVAFVAVRRYRALLIQAKVDQTRSSYRRFNHFDELSGRFWLRSWAGSADSMDNPAFTRSDELLHLRALDRPCCYHDDTMSLPSTCPSHGTRLNTIYPHSSQYAWRGSDMSVADGVLDSGKASDLSVCSWPVEPIHWTPFPLLQQLALRRSPAQVRVSRPRSYCEGMELVDMGKSWTA